MINFTHLLTKIKIGKQPSSYYQKKAGILFVFLEFLSFQGLTFNHFQPLHKVFPNKNYFPQRILISKLFKIIYKIGNGKMINMLIQEVHIPISLKQITT